MKCKRVTKNNTTLKQKRKALNEREGKRVTKKNTTLKPQNIMVYELYQSSIGGCF